MKAMNNLGWNLDGHFLKQAKKAMLWIIIFKMNNCFIVWIERHYLQACNRKQMYR